MPHTAIGISGTPASWAMRAAPDLKLFSVNDWEIVASGKTPTISPERRESSACAYAVSPCLRSTGMCFMLRISGPEILCRNTDSFAMKRTRRFCGRATRPSKMKSR